MGTNQGSDVCGTSIGADGIRHQHAHEFARLPALHTLPAQNEGHQRVHPPRNLERHRPKRPLDFTFSNATHYCCPISGHHANAAPVEVAGPGSWCCWCCGVCERLAGRLPSAVEVLALGVGEPGALRSFDLLQCAGVW